MAEEPELVHGEGNVSASQLLYQALQLVPEAMVKARATAGYPGRWKLIISKLERVSPCLSDLSSHPCFAKNALCRELLQSVASTLREAIVLADRCSSSPEEGTAPQPPRVGKLQMQSDLDALSGKLELNLRDCTLLMKSGVLVDAAPSPPATASSHGLVAHDDVRELLARLQIGHAEDKHRALDWLLEALRENEKSVLAVLGRSNISALVQLLSATSSKIREKAAAAVCSIVESGSCNNLLLSEGVLPPLIRLSETGSTIAREKAVISLQRLSMSAETARSIAGNGAVRSLVEQCRAGDSLCQSAAAGTLRNLSAVPDIRQALVEEGVIQVTINLLDNGTILGSKEYAAECLHNLTASNDGLRRSVVAEGGVGSLLSYIDGPLPQEPAVNALRNLVGAVPVESLLSQGLLPRLVHVLKDGSLGARRSAASIIVKISNSSETKKLISEYNCVALLVQMLNEKTDSAREVAAQAIAGLIMSCPQNSRELRKEEKSVPNLVRLLDPSPQNTAKKYAIACLLALSASKSCKKLMISHGAVGYLRKLAEMEVAGSKKLLERLEKGKLKRFFSRK